MASKSLGTLTLDLIAKVGGFEAGMDKASRKSKNTAKSIEKDLNAIAKTAAGLGVAAVAGLAAMTTSLAESAKEVQNLARISNASNQEFQKLTFGAKRYGIEQDKVADILKDTNDKIGDFLQTGGGPLADFFDNIAPSIGVTADQFARLSGPQALQLYVDSLEKANLTQSEMTFYMEAIASDATNLLPLLRNGGEEFKKLGDEADRTGNVLSDLDFQQLAKISQSTNALKSQFTGLSNEIVLAAIPAIDDLIELLGNPSTVAAAEKLGNAIVTSMTWAIKVMKGAAEVAQFLGEEIAAATQGIEAGDISRLERDANKIKEILNGGILDQVDRVRFFGPDGVVEFLDDNELKAKLTEITSAIDSYYENASNRPKINVDIEKPVVSDAGGNATGETKGPILGRDLGQDENKAVEAIDKQISALRLQVETFGQSEKAAELYGLKLDGASESQLALAESLLSSLDEKEQAKAALEDLTTQYQTLNDAALLAAGNQEELEVQRYSRLVENLENEYALLEEQGLVTAELKALQMEALENAEYDHQSKINDIREEARKADLDAENEKRRQISEGYIALLDVVGEYYDGMQGKQAGYARVAISLAQTLLDEDKRKALQEVWANTSSAAMKAYGALAGIPYVGPALGAAAAGAVYVAGGVAAAKITGMAHEGIDSVPETGTWLLEKGERVVTENTSAKLDNLLTRIDRDMAPANDGGSRGSSMEVSLGLDSGLVLNGLRSNDDFERVVMGIVRRNEG